MKRSCVILLAAGAILLVPGAQKPLRGQDKLSNMDRERAEYMLQVIRDEVKKHYYDAAYHGVDLDARFETYDVQIKQARDLSATFRDIAAYLSALHDSHTFFIPPSLSYRFDYGFRFQVIGDRAFITEVRPGSDAASKIHPGDEILNLGRFSVNRKDFADLSYYLYQLAPQGGVGFDLRSPAGQERREMVQTKFIQGSHLVDLTLEHGDTGIYKVIHQQEAQEHLLRQRWKEPGDTLIWKMPEFIIDENSIDEMFGRARKHKALILDLRGNPGGRVDDLEKIVGYVMDHDVSIAKRVSRKDEKPETAKSRGNDTFKGKVIVLVDSRSASAAELFARIIQLEHRGTVVGDQTAGAVMQSRFYPENIGQDRKIFYAVAITDANLIMSDGKSLEGVGVTPDVIVLPTAADLAAGRDPALAKAAELAGVKLDPEAAGKLFPFEWAPLSAE